MVISRKRIKKIACKIENKVYNHPVLRFVSSGGNPCNCTVEKNLVDCFNRLKILIDGMDRDLYFYMDVDLRGESLSASLK